MKATRGTNDQRFWAKVIAGPDGCWDWTGAPTVKGYGVIAIGRRAIRAHKYAYEALVADVPAGLVLDHLCERPICVNPWHLEPVTHGVNIRRGHSPTHVVRRSGVCLRGHRLTEDNIVKRGAPGRRRCRECANAKNRASQNARRALARARGR